MNTGYNASMYHMPGIVCQESVCQQSMYHQQRTIVDRNRTAVTDVYVQEQHVSQSSWAISTPQQAHVRPPVFLPGGGRGPYVGNNPIGPSMAQPQAQGRFPFRPVPGNFQYYASGSGKYDLKLASIFPLYSNFQCSASMNSYGFMQQYSGSYMPPYNSTPLRGQQFSKEIACQTMANIKRSCDAATQTDIIGDAPPMKKLNLFDW